MGERDTMEIVIEKVKYIFECGNDNELIILKYDVERCADLVFKRKILEAIKGEES